jgi:hypothetical protein
MSRHRQASNHIGSGREEVKGRNGSDFAEDNNT